MTTIAMLLMLTVGGDLPQNGDSGASTKPAVRAIRASHAVVLDARLTEPFWLQAHQVRDFAQRDPNEGAAPTESTVVFLAYDDEAMYVAARLYDRAPDSIVARLGRRDVYTSSDLFTVYLDPYHDRRSGFFFGINAASALYDGVLYNDDWDDNTWDGVWEGKASIDEQGWVVEMRIPYSQLRFRRADAQVWGVNFRREIARKNEILFYAPRPKNASGFVSRFADLVGIDRITPPRRLELLPYVNTRASYTDAAVGNPFNDGSRYTPAVGVDLRAGIGSNLTLNATVNPDFGQVEVDPAVVNLSDVETFFQEKRPFFVEGSSIFEFGFGGASNYWGFNWSGPSMFYTRRMGRAPQGDTPDADYTDRPDGVNILGALKLTGKVAGHWNLGALSALTVREYAELDTSGVRFEKEVEPLTYFGVVRAQREFPEGRHGLGTMITAVVRHFDDPSLRDQIAGDAFVAGVDGWTFLDRDKEWVVTGWVAGSHVRGTTERIRSLQENSVHYFQRPDAEQTDVDPNATALSGWAARFHLNKQKGNWFSNSGLGFISPGYETNDLGFMSRTGVINMHSGAGHAWRTPGKVFRYREVIGALFQSYNWDGDVTWRGVWQSTWVQFLNYWSIGLNQAYNPWTFADRRTRGGPLMRNPPGYEFNLNLNSDSRKRIVLGMWSGRYHQNSRDYDAWLGGDVTFRPAPNVSLSVGPNFNWSEEPGQYVTTYADPTADATFENRYVFADLSYTEVSAGIRLNWTFSPRLSLQVYAQPLVSAGAYTRFKALARPKTFDFDVYGTGTSTFVDNDSSYVIDADGAGTAAPADTLDNPDFSSTSLRGNAVLRWEFLPGSTIYFVWTQSRSESMDDGNFRFRRSMNRLFDATPDNTFMVKVSYWWNP
ncbi:MAG TPA: DUF5916 domain-containing protein [Gemmatimonadales bacterium]